MSAMRANRGFTLIELLVVVMIAGIIAGTLTIFLRPAIDSYLDTRRRSELTDMADTALRRIGQEVRSAVPNSVIAHSTTCFQFVPTIAGGRYRMAADTVTAGSLPLDPSTNTTQFDVLSPLAVTPANGDWVVINNQNGGDVYANLNRGAISNVTTPAATSGLHRITIASTQFPTGYDGGRFVIVPNASQSVFYNLVGTTLYRTVGTFASGNATCALSSGDTLATNVQNATFIYNPNKGATQQSGFIWMRIELARDGEAAALAYGVHVSNVP